MFKLRLWIISAGICSAASGQQDLIGTWELVGRVCEDDSSLVPLDDSIQHMTFNSGGDFRGTYYSLPHAGEMTLEEFREYKISRARERQDADEETHDRECERQNGEIFDEESETNICESREKEKLYKKWWSDRLKTVEEELEGEEPDDVVCEMASSGRWEAQGSELTITETSLSATPSCGLEDSSQERRSLSGEYYFENEDLYFTLEANENSREFCGSSDWSAVFFKK